MMETLLLSTGVLHHAELKLAGIASAEPAGLAAAVLRGAVMASGLKVPVATSSAMTVIRSLVMAVVRRARLKQAMPVHEQLVPPNQLALLLVSL